MPTLQSKSLTVGSSLSGFDILQIQPIEEYRAIGIWARHQRTGCQVYHICTAESDNLFAFAFKTPPENSTGVAHILEHTVLCGSKHFPVKDPFLLLLKGSMHTYMNALTFPDKTVYPASSQVEQDFYNLLWVYGDAVFFPLLRKETFLQEGHRREFTPDGKIEATGIVLNEMKGNYSSHDSIASEWAYRSLFDNSPYAFDSGGEPEEIVNLTYEEFVDFHRRYYHPSNCYVFFFGNLPTEKHLDFLEKHFLSYFSPLPETDRKRFANLTLTPRWSTPRRLVKAYPSGPSETIERGTSVTVNWLLGQVLDPLHLLSVEVLSEILLGHSGSPLTKALIESGLGEDLSPATGLETETLEISFSVGLRGTSPKREKKIENLIFSELQKLSEQGIDIEQVEGAVRRVEFRNREVKSPSNQGMRLMRRTLKGWIHGAPPEHTLVFRPWMDRLKAEWQKNPRYFEGLISTYLLQNPHRTTLLVVPEKDLEQKMEETLRMKVREEVSQYTASDWETLKRDLEAFRLFQSTPDPEEAIKAIPYLKIEDIPQTIETIPTTSLAIRGAKAGFAHDLYTNGIVYIDFALDLTGAEQGPFLWLPLFANALGEVGAGGKPYDRITLELQLKTGGFGASLEAGTLVGGGQQVRQFLFLRLKTLEELLPPSLDLIRTLLLQPDFEDARRIKELLQEYRNDFKSSIIPQGSSYAAIRAERGISEAEAREEQWKGISQYLFVHAQRNKSALEQMAREFQTLQAALFIQNRFFVNLTYPESKWSWVIPQVENLLLSFPTEGKDLGSNSSRAKYFPKEVPRKEGLLVPSSVGFVALALRGSLLGTKEYAHEAVLAHLLSTGFLWEKIRMEGGAYGAYCAAHGREELFSFSSYRDPNVLNSYRNFSLSLEHVAWKKPDPRTTQDAIIGAVAKDMKPLSPGGKSIVAFKRSLYGITDPLREYHRQLMLSTRPEDLQQAAQRLLERVPDGYASFLANREALSFAAQELPDLKDRIEEIPL
ncbi:MAG: insulinase family protein [Spirochaetales bacterium]